MALLAAPPDVIRWSPRSQGHGDCAVAALEIACGVTYETALAAALGACPDVLTRGLNWPEIRKAAGFLGFKTRLTKRFDLDEDTGILDVWQEQGGEHVVYLWEGRIIEPMHDRQQLWLSAQSFLTHYHYTHGSLLTFKEGK
jgi:hypothetical protein